MDLSPQLDNIFCPKHSDCLAPISVITDILSENDPSKFKKISSQFKRLRFKKIRDLANATVRKVSSIKLCGDSLTLLNRAIEIYSERLDNLLERAKLEYQNGNFAKTQEICIDLLKQKPANLNVLLIIANSFFERKDYDTCIHYLKIAKTIDTNSPDVNMNLGLVYSKKSENSLAKLYMSTACLSNPFCYDNLTTYANFLFDVNNFEAAQAFYEFILRSNPDLFKVRTKYAKVLFCTNKIEDAKQQFKIALNNAPTFLEGLESLADLYFTINKFDKAIVFYLKALEINPDAKIILYNLGIVYLKTTEHQKAVEAFEKAIKLDPEYFNALKYLSVAYCHQKKMTLSVETFKKCLLLEPDNFDINLELAMINFNNLVNYQEAEIYFKKCIELNSERKDLYKHLFSVYQRLKKHTNSSDICISLGDLYMKDDDLETAIKAYKSAIFLNETNAICHWKLGFVMYKLGHLDLALIRYRKAIFLEPTFAKSYSDCAIIYEKQGNLVLAKEYYQAAIQRQPINCDMKNMLDLQHKICELDERIKSLEIGKESVEINEQIE